MVTKVVKSNPFNEMVNYLKPGDGFVVTPYITGIVESALTYLQAGLPVHFSGPSGTGKTTLAFYVASKLCRNITLIRGDDFSDSNFVYRDGNYSHWANNLLTNTHRNNHVLIYDDFNYSRSVVNNVLLNVLQERFFSPLTQRIHDSDYFAVQPGFCAILTSNPEKNADTHKTYDALIDKLVTIQLQHFDRETEIKIVVAKSNISWDDAENIVDIIRRLRNTGLTNQNLSIQTATMIAHALAIRGGNATWDNPNFRRICQDIFNDNSICMIRDGKVLLQEKITEAIKKICDSKYLKCREESPLSVHYLFV